DGDRRRWRRRCRLLDDVEIRRQVHQADGSQDPDRRIGLVRSTPEALVMAQRAGVSKRVAKAVRACARENINLNSVAAIRECAERKTGISPNDDRWLAMSTAAWRANRTIRRRMGLSGPRRKRRR